LAQGAAADVVKAEFDRREDRPLEITTGFIRQGIAEYLDLFEVGATNADLPRGANDRESGGFEIDQATTDGFAGDRVGAGDQPTE
jgi:hypothetical protein